MAINVDVTTQATIVEVATPGTPGTPGATGAPLTNFDTTPTWRAPRPQNNGAITGTVTNSMYLSPFFLPTQVTVTGLACHVNGAGTTNAFVNVVLYDDTGAMVPKTLLAQTGAISALTSGSKVGTFAGVVLTPGIYWTGIHLTGTGTMCQPQLAQYGPEFWMSFSLGTGSAPNYAQGNDGTTAGYSSGLSSPPATFAGTIFTDSNAPKVPSWVALKVNR